MDIQLVIWYFHSLEGLWDKNPNNNIHRLSNLFNVLSFFLQHLLMAGDLIKFTGHKYF